MSPHASRARAIYRQLLRELPARRPSLLANPSPLQQQLRGDFGGAPAACASLQHQAAKPPARRLAEAEQYLHYLAAQRLYTALLERYNPGLHMPDHHRVRLTARRVGLDLPAAAAAAGGARRE